jgi:tripeptide aminopeptidase
MQNVVNRFIKYVKYDTKSDEESNTVPSTPGQLVLAEILGQELKEIGMSDVTVDNNGYVMATLPSNITRKVPVIGFIAHMDTSPDMSGTNVNPIIIENYDGKDLVLNAEKNIVTAIKDFPELKSYIGKALIITDGTTLLGADDKAGIAEIITAMEFLLAHPEIEHGTIRIGFTPDEEIGNGADHFDVKKFNADFAYTLDGGPIGELEYENFNAAGVKISIQGTSVHPGSAKDKMINSMLIANEFISSLPDDEVPSKTEGYEGFYHLVGVNGNVELTTLHYIIRDFDLSSFENRKATLQSKVDALNLKYGSDIINAVISDQYFNMREIIEKHMYIVDTAYKAMEAVGVVPLVKPIRGGTDGSRLSYMGLPTPNIFAGGHNFHGKHEFIPTYAMEKAVEVILKVVELFAN